MGADFPMPVFEKQRGYYQLWLWTQGGGQQKGNEKEEKVWDTNVGQSTCRQVDNSFCPRRGAEAYPPKHEWICMNGYARMDA